MKITRLLTTTVLVLLTSVGSFAAADSTRVYDQQHKLIYEDAWDLWPYAFLNDRGEPDGFNIDLIRLLMKELDIPYEIHLKPASEAFHDLKSGRSDLMLGLAVGFHDEFGQYSKNAVTLFTQSVVTPIHKEVEIKNFKDLANHKVIVSDSSLCHHLMIDYGWGNNAIPHDDIREAILKVSAEEDGQIVWNTLSLKYLMQRYHIENLVMTPVNMPHGEYKFMSNDPRLLDRLDEAYTRLYSAEKLTPIQNKWFYPERQPKGVPLWVWYVTGAALLLILIFSIYSISYRIQARQMTRENTKRNKRLALILETSQVRIWTYDIAANHFAWRGENGQVAYTYTMDEFAQRYSPKDFIRLKEVLNQLADTPKPEGEEEEVVLTLRAKDVEGGDTEERDYYIVLSVLSRNKEGRPTVIIGTKKDVTEEQERKRLSDERTLRYWAVFNTSMVGIMLFDREGYLQNINPKACEIYDCDHDEIISQHVHLEDVLDTGNLDLQDVDDYFATQIVNIDRIPAAERKIPAIHHKGKLYNEFRLMTVRDDAGELIGIFAICRNVEPAVKSMAKVQEARHELDRTEAKLREYDGDIDSVLLESDVRLASYSPHSHTLTIYRTVNEVQHVLTQTRCMTLVDDRSKNLAMRMLNTMDEGEDKNIRVDVRTTLRIRGGHRLNLQFCLMPVRDRQGHVTEYIGLVRDLSELRDIVEHMAEATAKVVEVENTKNSFVNNMVQEIRTPMDTIIHYVSQLNDQQPSDNEAEVSQQILSNADYLLHLIDNILYLSRLDAHMVEINKQQHDFAELFEAMCTAGWEKHQNEQTRYVVESPYEHLVVDIDAENLGNAVKQLTANAAQYTQKGVVRTRYDYMGRRLMITVDDTGRGISPDELARINKQESGKAHTTKGLGLAICKELLRQMGGTIEINSETGQGTTVYITIPCHASVIKRKR